MAESVDDVLVREDAIRGDEVSDDVLESRSACRAAACGERCEGSERAGAEEELRTVHSTGFRPKIPASRIGGVFSVRGILAARVYSRDQPSEDDRRRG